MDLGNYQSTTTDGKSQTTIRSIFVQLPEGCPSYRSNKRSPVLVIDGIRYHVGPQAENYEGYQSAVTGEKLDWSKLFFLATVPQSALDVGQCDLVVTHHTFDDPEVDLRLQTALLGEHSFRRHGRDYTVSVKSVTLAPEGFGAWHLVYPNGHHTNKTMVVDIGGGSWVAGVLDQEGNAIAKTLNDKNGVVKLARQIGRDTRLTSVLKSRGVTRADVAAVMQGLATDQRYLGSPETDWSQWSGPYIDRWWSDIVGAAKTEFQHLAAGIDRIIVVGGGAHLLRDRYQGSQTVIIPNPPHLAAIVGTWKSCQGGDS